MADIPENLWYLKMQMVIMLLGAFFLPCLVVRLWICAKAYDILDMTLLYSISTLLTILSDIADFVS